jgi:hypothetical protein
MADIMKRHEVNQIMAIAKAAAVVDDQFDDLIDKAGNIARDHGGSADEIEAMRQMQREWLAQYRAGLGVSLVSTFTKALL